MTNLDPADADTAQVLIRYKGQPDVERRYGDFKGPLAVAPMFLKSTRRIHALISVICLACALLAQKKIPEAIRNFEIGIQENNSQYLQNVTAQTRTMQFGFRLTF